MVVLVHGSCTIEHSQEILSEEVNEVVQPIKRAQNGDLLALVTVEQEVSQNRDNFRIEE